eukprot:145966_1
MSRGSFCCLLFFWILVLCVLGYLFYVMSILPMIVNKHRLRFNQLDRLEIYTMDTADWFNYSISTEGVRILTFKQQIPFEYAYALAFASYPNETDIDTNMTSLEEVSWDTFADSVHMNMDLYIIQYSSAMCGSLEQCLQQEQGVHDMLVFTVINTTHFINLNSELVSTLLDDPRDTFNILIAVAMIVLMVCILLLLQTPPLAKASYMLLVLTCVIFGTYLLHVFGLIVVPICFSLPLHMTHDNQIDYFEVVSHSLVYSVGDYEPIVWVIGVIIHGIWVWSVTLLFPFISCVYGFVLCVTCCNDDRADTLGLVVIMPMLWMLWFAMVLMSIAYLIMFCVNMLLWTHNPITYNVNLHRNELHFIQTLLGIGCIWIIVPMCGCLMSQLSNLNITNNKYTQKLTNRVTSLPIVRRTIKQQPTNLQQDEKDGYENETIAHSMYHNQENVMINQDDEENEIYEY